jgi:hypothetical protein
MRYFTFFCEARKQRRREIHGCLGLRIAPDAVSLKSINQLLADSVAHRNRTDITPQMDSLIYVRVQRRDRLS